MTSPELEAALKRIEELESSNEAFIQFVEYKKLIVDLPHELQDLVLSTHGAYARNTYLDKIKYRISCTKTGDGRAARMDYWFEEMVRLHEPMQRLLEYPGGERAIFDLYVSVACADGAPEEVVNCSQQFGRVSDWKLDDLLVDVTLCLLRKEPISDALNILIHLLFARDQIRSYRNIEVQDALAHHAQRFQQLLREVSVVQVARLTSERTLAGRLPPEVIKEVGDWMILGEGLPATDIFKLWSTPRPGRECRDFCKSDGRYGFWTSDCPMSTCSRRTMVEWHATDHQWISTHTSVGTNRKIAICKSVGNSVCGTHHDHDIWRESWETIISKPPSWSRHERWEKQCTAAFERWKRGPIAAIDRPRPG